MPQQILDSDDISATIEQIRSHRMTKLMTGDRNTALLRVILHTLLNSPYRKWPTLVGTFLNQKDFSELRTESIRGYPRPLDDKYSSQMLMSDSLYFVWGTKAH